MLLLNAIRLFNLISGIVLLLGGGLFLVLPCLFVYKDYTTQTIDICTIVCNLNLLIFSIITLYVSATCFIKYGMAKGGDYYLEKHSKTTRK